MIENKDEKLKIVRGRVKLLVFYEITAEELEILERGAPSSIYLNFSISLLSMSLSFFSALVTVPSIMPRLFTILVVITITGFIIGSLLLILWSRTHHSLREIVKKIKSRIPNESEMNWKYD